MDSVITANASHEWIVRLMVRQITVRLINYWGYDVATYDSDAVVLKNPQELYQKYQSTHLLSSASVWPNYLAEPWGFTLCGGAALFKASSGIGKNAIICMCIGVVCINYGNRPTIILYIEDSFLIA